MTESGYPKVGFHPDVWMGIFAPARTPPTTVERLNREINDVLRSAEMAPSLKRFGYDAKLTTPAEFAAFFAEELRKFPPLLRAAGFKPQG
jgi:tripartite-type tricarboxylate transporter receptor subunit TctC